MTSETSNLAWEWWASRDAEIYRIGPCKSRDEVIAEATHAGEGIEGTAEDGSHIVTFYIVEAQRGNLRLADWIGAEDALERADESVADSDVTGSEADEPPYFKATPDQEADLAARLRRACDDWQEAHGLTFTCATFSASRNEETITVPDPYAPVSSVGSE